MSAFFNINGLLFVLLAHLIVSRFLCAIFFFFLFSDLCRITRIPRAKRKDEAGGKSKKESRERKKKEERSKKLEKVEGKDTVGASADHLALIGNYFCFLSFEQSLDVSR